jgi:hypothetical protein
MEEEQLSHTDLWLSASLRWSGICVSPDSARAVLVSILSVKDETHLYLSNPTHEMHPERRSCAGVAQFRSRRIFCFVFAFPSATILAHVRPGLLPIHLAKHLPARVVHRLHQLPYWASHRTLMCNPATVSGLFFAKCFCWVDTCNFQGWHGCCSDRN